MIDFEKYKTHFSVAIVMIAIVFFSGFYYGKNHQTDEEKIASIINKNDPTGTVDFAAFWKAWATINEKYIPSNASTTVEKVSDQARVYGAIQGMTAALKDPYTVFFPPVESKSFGEQISGQIEGVGMEVGVKDVILTVIAPIKDSPAYRAGVKSGDKILKIDDTVTNALNTEKLNLITSLCQPILSCWQQKKNILEAIMRLLMEVNTRENPHRIQLVYY
jgi:carboxyl-terminal processing protease